MPEHVHLLISEPARGDPFGAEDVEAARFAPAKAQIPSRRFACAASVSVCLIA